METVRRGLAPVLAGRRIVAASAHESPKFRAAAEVVGATALDVDRRGKYLLVPLDDGRRLVLHLGMTGQLGLSPVIAAGDPYIRARWDLDDGSLLLFRDVRRFGRVAVVGDDFSALPTLAHLGPEPLGADFTADGLWRDLRRSRVRVKTQLLGQRVVAGVGNIYADEALWRAGISPAARQVSRPAAGRLREAVVHVLTEAIANGGTTLRDYRTVGGESGSNQFQLRCYGRAGQACLRCGQVLRRRVLDGRSTTWCPSCQPR